MDYVLQSAPIVIHMIVYKIDIFEIFKSIIYTTKSLLEDCRLIQPFYKKTNINVDKIDVAQSSTVVTDGFDHVWKSVSSYEYVYEWQYKHKNYYNCHSRM